LEHTIPYILQWDESLDIGSDTGTPVNDADYQIPFTFTGKLNKITLTIDRPKLSAEDIKRLRETAQAATDGPSSETVEAASESAQLRASGDSGKTLLEKFDLRIKKIEGCRKQADAQHLGRTERIRFAEKCMR
jgi:arylsulfatase